MVVSNTCDEDSNVEDDDDDGITPGARDAPPMFWIPPEDNVDDDNVVEAGEAATTWLIAVASLTKVICTTLPLVDKGVCNKGTEFDVVGPAELASCLVFELLTRNLDTTCCTGERVDIGF